MNSEKEEVNFIHIEDVFKFIKNILAHACIYDSNKRKNWIDVLCKELVRLILKVSIITIASSIW